MPDYNPERTQFWNQLAARDQNRDKQKEVLQLKAKNKKEVRPTFDSVQGRIYYRPVTITHFGNLGTDQAGYFGDLLQPGDVASASESMKAYNVPYPYPKPEDNVLTYTYTTPVIIYYDNGASFHGNVVDWGQGNFIQKVLRENWIDVWDPEKSRKGITNHGWIAFKSTQKPQNAVEVPPWKHTVTPLNPTPKK